MYNVAIIGCGRISHKIVEGAAKNRDRIKLVALCDPIEEKMYETEKTYNKKMEKEVLLLKYRNYNEILKQNKIDIAIISTESGYHEKIGLYFLENGVNVIIEKPLAMSIEGAQRLVDTAKKNNLKLAASHQNRFNYPIQLLKKQ